MKKDFFIYLAIIFAILLSLGLAGRVDYEEEREMHFSDGWENHISHCQGCNKCASWRLDGE